MEVQVNKSTRLGPPELHGGTTGRWGLYPTYEDCISFLPHSARCTPLFHPDSIKIHVCSMCSMNVPYNPQQRVTKPGSPGSTAM